MVRAQAPVRRDFRGFWRLASDPKLDRRLHCVDAGKRRYRANQTMAIRRILVPVDYSECSGAALAVAIDLAKKFGAEVDVIHVWDRPSYVPDELMVHQPSGPSRSLADLIRENAEREMDAFIKAAELPAEIPVTHRLLSGNPAAIVLSELRAARHDLLVIGTHGRTGLRHLLLGSVAEKLVRLSPVPVLTVPPPGDPAG
jgi:nucleotide-binding universal stress UspA family protein